MTGPSEIAAALNQLFQMGLLLAVREDAPQDRNAFLGAMPARAVIGLNSNYATNCIDHFR